MLGRGVSLGIGVSLGVGVIVGGRGVLVKVAGVRFGVLVGIGVLGVFVAAGVVFCAVGTAVLEAMGVCPGAEYTFRFLVSPVVVA